MTEGGIAASGLRVSFVGGPTVLDGASLVVDPGERTALLGANGSGKTTVLRCLAGAIEPDAGTVTVGDTPLRRSRSGLRAHRQQVQLVLQDPDDQLFSADVVRDVAYGPLNLGLAESEVRDRVDEALSLMGIEHLRRRPTHQLSHGERKRVATAGAVAMRPRILLLDEPTAGLDPVGVEEMFGAFDRLERAGTTVVLSTHDVALALEWAHTVAIVAAGTVVQGAPTAMLSDDALLGRARLTPPWVVQLSRDLARAGLIDPRADLRGLRDVTRALEQWRGR